jgi:hypothetical protein
MEYADSQGQPRCYPQAELVQIMRIGRDGRHEVHRLCMSGPDRPA